MEIPYTPPKKLLDRFRDALKHYYYRTCHARFRDLGRTWSTTEQTYAQWIRRFILFHNKGHPQEMGIPEIEAFLTHDEVRIDIMIVDLAYENDPLPHQYCPIR